MVSVCSNICNSCLLYHFCQVLAPLSLYLPHKLRQKNSIMRNCSSAGVSSTPSHHPAHQRPVREKIVKETLLYSAGINEWCLCRSDSIWVFCLAVAQQKIDLINVTLHCWLETVQTMVVSSNIVISLLLNYFLLTFFQSITLS